MESAIALKHHEPWNKGKLVGQKVPFKSKEIWSIRVRLQMEQRVRELALCIAIRQSTPPNSDRPVWRCRSAWM